jgi:hypothetical protein
LLWFLSLELQIADQIEKQVRRPVLPSWPVLIHNRVNGNCLLNAGHLVSGLIGF